MNYTFKPVLSATAVLLFATCAPEVQGQIPLSREQASRETMAREAAESEEREMLIELTERYRKRGEQREPRLAFTQIKEDFLRLQIVNNELAKVVAGGEQLDLKLVAKSASEIRKRAERLKDNLALPKAAEREKIPASAPPADLGQLKTALSRLDGIVLRFSNNLHAKGVRRFDAEASGRLRRDLEAIVSLSERVRKSSEKLGEANR